MPAIHRAKYRFVPSPRLLSALALYCVAVLSAGSATAYDVPWENYVVDAAMGNPMAMTALEIDGTGPLEVVVLGDELPVHMSILSSAGAGAYMASPLFTIDEFGAGLVRLDRLTALAAYDTTGATTAKIVIAGTPPGGASPFYRIYSISSGLALTELAEIEMNWLNFSTVGEVRCVTDIGDLDGNGTNDLAFGFPADNRVEIVFLDVALAVTGHQTIQQGVGGFLGNLMVDGELLVVPIGPTDELGFSLTRLADYAPGLPDSNVANLAVGIPGHNSDYGMVSLIALNSDGTVYFDRGWNATALGTISASKGSTVDVPAEAGSRFGASVTWVPEFNYDFGDTNSSSAQGDLLVGIPGLDEAGLHADPDTLATPRNNVGAIAMLDVLVFNAIYTQNWLVIGDRSGGMCRQLPAGAALGRNAVVVGDVFDDGTDDYLVLGDEVTATHGDNAEMLLLDMKAARLWHWDYSGPDHWEPVGPIAPTDRLAALGITSTEPDLTGSLHLGGFKFGSCFRDDPITVTIPCSYSDKASFDGDSVIEPGCILVLTGDLYVNATLTNKGEITTVWGCYETTQILGTGQIELTAAGTLSVDRYFDWWLGPAVNYGLIRDSGTFLQLRFFTTLTNYGSIEFDGTDLAGLAFETADNYGEIRMRSGNGGFAYTTPAAIPNALVNHPGATLDLHADRAGGQGQIKFDYYSIVNDGLLQLRGGDADDFIRFSEGFENSGTVELIDDVHVNSGRVIWNGGALGGTGGLLDIGGKYAEVNADWTIPTGIELRRSLSINPGTPSLSIADGKTLLIEGLLSSQCFGYNGGRNLIDGPGTFRIEAGGQLRVQEYAGWYSILEVETGAFECAGSIVVDEANSAAANIALYAYNGLLIEPGGELLFDAPGIGSGTPIRSFYGSLTNQGTVRVDLPPGSSMQWPQNGAIYDNQGTIEVLSDLNVSGTGSFVLDPASSIEIGAGATMTVPSSLNNPGSLSFGEAGVLSVNGSMTQSGPLTIELGNAQPSAGNIQAMGTADFTGDFNLQTALGFDPSLANSHAVASYANVTLNQFSSEVFPTAGGIEWRLSYDPSELLVNLHLFSMLSYDLAAGVLVDVAPASGLVRPSVVSKMALPTAGAARLASARSGNQLYALLDPGPSASLMAIDPKTLSGTTPLSLTGTAVGSASAIVVDLLGNIVVAFDGTTTPSLLGQISRTDLVGGHAVLSRIRHIVFSPPTPGAKLDLMAVSPEGQLYALDDMGGGNVRLWSIDRSTGVGITSADIIYLAGTLDGMEFLGDELWASCSSAGELIRIDPSDGSVDEVISLVDGTAMPLTGLGGLTWRAVADVGTVVRLRTVPEGGALLIDAPGYSPPASLIRFDLYRGKSLAELAYGAPTLIDSQASLDFVDATTVDYTTYYYRVDVIADDGLSKAAVLDTRLYSKPGISRPLLLLSELAPSGGVAKVGERVEIQNLSSISQDLAGYRLSNGTVEETLSGTVAAFGFFVHTLASIDLPDAGGILSLLAPGSDYVFDSVGWGTDGGAPAVPSGFTISRVDGTLSEDPDATSFDISTPTIGATNNVPPPALGSSLLINEVYFEGAGGQDYIEIVNPLGSTIVLDEFAISDGAGFLEMIASGVQLASGQLYVLDNSSTVPFAQDLQATTLYMYQVTESGSLQRIDQLGWGASIPDFAPPPPVVPNDAIVRSPDGGAVYLGEQGANWTESGGGVTMFYGPQSPGLPNTTEYTVSLVVDPMGGGDATTIAAAMLAASAGTRILIQPGNYPESVTLASGVDLVGVTVGEENAVIQGDGIQPALVGSGVDASTTISNLVVESATGGMDLTSSSPSVRNVVFRNNLSTSDGAAVKLNGGTPSFLGCLFEGNQAQQNGGALQLSSGTASFRYCLFVRNSAGSKGGIVHATGGTANLSNCVLDDNSAGEGILHSNGGNIVTEYSTLTNSSLGAALRSEAGTNAFSCGLVFNHPDPTPPSDVGVTLNNVINVDPGYCQPSKMNYGYSDASPLVALGSSCGVLIGISGPPCALVIGAPSVVARTQFFPATPNPFNPATTLRFELARAGRVSLDICDVRGRLVSRPLDAVHYDAGVHEVVWRGRDNRGRQVASGVYFALIRLDGRRVGPSRSLVLLK